MAIQLQKSQGIKLTKQENNVEQVLSTIKLGCGWKASQGWYSKKKQITTTVRKGLFGLGKPVEVIKEIEEKIPVGSIDIDASVFAFCKDSLVGKCYFGNQKMLGNGQIIAQSSGDNLRGSTGKTDDETITINIDKIGNFADTLYLALNIYGAHQRGQHFDMVENAYVRVYDDKGIEMAHFDLTENYDGKTGIIVGKLVKVDGVFQFIALGDGVKVKNLDEFTKIVKDY